ncbi:Uncharacterised protein [Helicobacter cinaedi]|uniref:Uncharacterized protein n=1 Tax=Helicobacter cinaedi TaxID=213 RepID=A0A377JSH3_9HELI|nr:hypothetical protein [Helicobacter cinaedi]STP10774.1 Uncharacterised protein [Helicobacter cinaedi]
MKQKEQVIITLENNGGFATLSQLYHLVDTGAWGTKTPFASIRRIVQTNEEFYKIAPGLWGLKSRQQNIDNKLLKNQAEFNHSYYQALVILIGNLRGFETFIPQQDKNKYFLQSKLSTLASLQAIYPFTHKELVQKAKYTDCIWFNERKMPHAFYEVEHSTNIKNSINRFYELQDFRAKFYIIAHKNRYKEFENIMSSSIYKNIKNFIYFADYDSIAKQYEQESMKYEMGI